MDPIILMGGLAVIIGMIGVISIVLIKGRKKKVTLSGISRCSRFAQRISCYRPILGDSRTMQVRRLRFSFVFLRKGLAYPEFFMLGKRTLF